MLARFVIASICALALFSPVGLIACGGASDVPGQDDAAQGSQTVNLVAYATPKLVYDELVPAFAKTPAGRDIAIRSSFGPSGDQSRAVAAGQPADIVSFSVRPDMTRLVKAGLVDQRWSDGPNAGHFATSYVTFIVRKGNPKGINTWDDLVRPGVEVLTPSPQSSGAAKWNLLAAYGQASRRGADPKAGLAYLRRLLTEHVKVQDKSAREALQSFLAGKGDVLLSFEYEAITAQNQGEPVDYVIPDETIDIDLDIALTRTAPPAARTLLDYLLSAPAQQIFADWGYRPVDTAVMRANAKQFPVPPRAFTIDDLGGWDTLDPQLFDPQDGQVTRIENERR